MNTTKYMPRVGDVVRFKDILMVVIYIDLREKTTHLSYDRTYYLLEESCIDCKTPVCTDSLLCKCLTVNISPKMSKLPEFEKIASKRYEIKQISYTQIKKRK